MEVAPSLVLDQYAQLPRTGKPQPGEWTVVAGIVLHSPSEAPRVVALGSGTKCLPAAAVAADTRGSRLHDTHAEVGARRALRLFLMDQLERAARGAPSIVVPRADGRGYDVAAGVEFHLFSSAPPCGDAAVVASAGPAAAAAQIECERPPTHAAKRHKPSAASPPAASPPAASPPAASPPAASPPAASPPAASPPAASPPAASPPAASPPAASPPAASPPANGSTAPLPAEQGKECAQTGARPVSPRAAEGEAAARGRACVAGVARTKPGRGERTCCMSCSDKLARWHAVGVQGALLSLLIPTPLRLASVTAGGRASLDALLRAIASRVTTPSAPAAPRVAIARGVAFEYAQPSEGDTRPCSNALLWYSGGTCEAVNGLTGLRMGANKRSFSPKHRAQACKALLLRRFCKLCIAVPKHHLPPEISAEAMSRSSYASIKGLATAYQQRKLEFLQSSVFREWVIAPPVCEAFTDEDVNGPPSEVQEAARAIV
ncbi:hypothetical protein AB1Y20_005450 [Prymnesium parvum]|uniref:tRNA-specific adenosine deaminase 1 n=1 Tax=Prymnesium parvum TaxID=97485 RepID=A0AB34J471_PRYPA